MEPSTGTVCPFPYTSANGSPKSLNECTVTYASYLGAPYFTFLSVQLIVSLIGLIVMLYRLRVTSVRLQVRNVFDVRLRFFALGALISFFGIIDAINLFGFQNLAFSYQAYRIVDQSIPMLICIIGFFIIDIWVRIASPSLSIREYGFPLSVRIFVISFVFANFIGFEILALYNVACQQNLYQGLKAIGGACVGFSLMMYAIKSFYVIFRVLRPQSRFSKERNEKKMHLRSAMAFNLFIFSVMCSLACITEIVIVTMVLSLPIPSCPALVIYPVITRIDILIHVCYIFIPVFVCFLFVLSTDKDAESRRLSVLLFLPRLRSFLALPGVQEPANGMLSASKS